jgi:hypothetical protein
VPGLGPRGAVVLSGSFLSGDEEDGAEGDEDGDEDLGNEPSVGLAVHVFLLGSSVRDGVAFVPTSWRLMVRSIATLA